MVYRLAPICCLLLACDTGFKETPADGQTSSQDGTIREGGTADLGPHDGAAADAAAPAECPGPVKSENVDLEHDPGLYSSIAVAADGTVHISHYAAGPTPNIMGQGGWHDARYTVRRGGTWSSEDIYTAGVIGAFSALGLGPQGDVHVVYYDYAQRDLLYSRNDLTSWKSPRVIASEHNVGWGNALAVDAQGTVHVVTFRGAEMTEDGEWHYLRRVAGTWLGPVVLQTMAGGEGPKPGLAVDAQGNVHVSFCNAQHQLLYRKGKDGSFGTAQIVATDVGDYPASDLAVDGAGQVHISFHDEKAGVLRYVGQTKSVFGTPVVLDSTGHVGSSNAIAATQAGDLWVAYFDETNRDLKLIRRQGGSWGQPQLLDSAGEVGQMVDAALGPEGELHISHHDITNEALRHTRVCP